MRRRDRQQPATRRRRRWPRVVLAVVVLLLAYWVPFVWFPRSDGPGRADAVFVLGGTNMNVRVETGANLIRHGYAPYLVISRSNPTSRCEEFADLAGTEMECDRPEPFTTQGEARMIARISAEHGWRSIIVVTSRDQATRARVRIRRCWHGGLRLIAVPIPVVSLAYETVYETAAMVKAEVLQRGC